MLEVVATTPSRPLVGCIVVRLDIVLRSAPGFGLWLHGGRRTRAVATNFYTPKRGKFPIRRCKTKGHIRSRNSGLRLRKNSVCALRFRSKPEGTHNLWKSLSRLSSRLQSEHAFGGDIFRSAGARSIWLLRGPAGYAVAALSPRFSRRARL